jgi:hypothetical protein
LRDSPAPLILIDKGLEIHIPQIICRHSRQFSVTPRLTGRALRAAHAASRRVKIWTSRKFGDESSSKDCRIRSLAGMAIILTELTKLC